MLLFCQQAKNEPKNLVVNHAGFNYLMLKVAFRGAG